ncbi:MAG: hypothetical protein H6861_07695 [Rhodospirillales bacterium]|nr:hypothetical protein [Rhodospirillales bacterium]
MDRLNRIFAASVLLAASGTTAADPQPENGTITPWSAAPTDRPVTLPADLINKNVRRLDHLASAALYYELYDNAAKRLSVYNPKTGKTEIYEFVENINNPQSGSHFKIIKNPNTGHYVLFAKGMDMPGRDEGAGEWGFLKDSIQHGHTTKGCLTTQAIDGEKAYLHLLQNPEVTSIEIIGYSIGSTSANYLAAIYGASVTNIADLGIPGTIARSSSPDDIFNTCSHGTFPPATGAIEHNMHSNIKSLKLRCDLMGGLLGDIGKEFGKVIVLGDGPFMGHVPKHYANAVYTYDPDAPKVETLEAFPKPLF